MRGNMAFPFVTIPDELVQFSPWMIGTVNEPLYQASEVLENWDYARDLEVVCELNLCPKVISDHLQIPMDDMRLEVCVRAGTGKGRLPRTVWEIDRREINSQSGTIRMSGQLKGSGLSARLHLECLILIASAPGLCAPISPKKPGSRLWSRQCDILLEDGGDSRFPMESVSFKSAFPGKPYEGAPWYFYWHPGTYHMDFAGSTRLYVNNDRDRMHERIVEGDPLFLQPVVYDVISQILAVAVADELFWQELAEYSEESIGGQARHWLGMAFSGMNPETIKSMLKYEPGAFNATILSVAEMEGHQ